jgi:TPR repeat protein
MSSAIFVDKSNWFRLQHLIDYSYVCLRRLFKQRYQLFFKQIWDDSPTLGNRFYNQNIRPYSQNFDFYRVQITSICNGNSEDWDLTTLTALLLNIHRPKHLKLKEIQVLDKQDKLLKDLRNIRNELAHHATRRITDTDFNSSWQQLKSILTYFGEDDTELDKLKDDIEFKSLKETVDSESVKEMNELNVLGNQSFKDKNYIDAIKHFTKATTLPHILSKDRALLYSNLSRTRLALCEQSQENDSASNTPVNVDDERYHASKDAKQARNLWPTWWKAHFRLGNAYVSMNEHEKAINSFERALALDPLNSEVKLALDNSRSEYSQQQRHEHLDPRLKPQTMGEHLKEMEEKFGIDPEQVRLGHLFAEMNSDTTLANVNKGHIYMHGDPDKGIKQDYDQAARYFAEAARQGNAEGMYNLALMYDRGLGVKKDHSLATQFFEKAALQTPTLPKTNLPNNGVAEAQHALGLRYYNGIDVTKNFATAAKWYRRAAENGCGSAANNLGLMYADGGGIEQDSVKSEQWLHFAAKKGDPNAMLTMSILSLKANDFEMAKLWHQRACDAGHVMALANREEFLSTINQRQHLVAELPPPLLHIFNESTKVTDLANIKPMPSKSSSFVYNYEQLQDYASKGSVTAKRLCNALEHYHMALYIIMEPGNIDENRFIHELAEAYCIEDPVVHIVGSELQQKFQTIINTLLKSEPENVDAQICYVYFHSDALEQNAKFLNKWKLKNPKSVHLYDVSAAVNCFLKRYQAALLDCNTGLKLDSMNDKLLYTKAVALRQLPNIDQNDIVAAYQKFLAAAPNDHRKVPESYYAMALYSIPKK